METFTPDKLLAGDYPAVTDILTILSGQNLVRGTLLGKIALSVPATGTAGAGNTGNGTCTLVAGKSAAIVETFTLTCIAAGIPTAGVATGAAVAGNAGDGTITAAPAVGAGAKVGVYRLTCVETGANVGGFMVQDPDGVNLGIATVAVEFTGGGLTFTIADGNADFAAGDEFTITVAAVAANGGVFSVVGSKTGRLADAAVGVAYTNSCIGFTINDGNADFIVGDTFTIAIAAGSGKYKLCVSTAVDGSQAPQAILAEDCDASLADTGAVAYLSGSFNQAAVTFGGADTADTHRAALRDLNIYLKAAA